MSNHKESAVSGLGNTLFLALLACLTATAFLSYQRSDYVTAGVAAAIALGALLGYWKGAVGFLALGLAGCGAFYLAGPLEPYLGPILRTPLAAVGATSDAVRIGACGVLTFGVIQIVALVLGRRLIRNYAWLEEANASVGMLLGSLQAAAAVGLFLCGILAIEPRVAAAQQSAGGVLPQQLSYVETLAHRTRNSAVFPYLQQYDPFQRFPALKQSLEAMQPLKPPPPRQSSFLFGGPPTAGGDNHNVDLSKLSGIFAGKASNAGLIGGPGQRPMYRGSR